MSELKFNGLRLNPGTFMRYRRYGLSPLYYPPVASTSRGDFLKASDQKETSECVSFGITNIVEARNWRLLTIPEQISPHEHYLECKRLDGSPNEDGTTLEAGLQAAVNLGLLPNLDGIRTVTTQLEVRMALHQHRYVLGAFMATSGWVNATPDGWIIENGTDLGPHCVVIHGANFEDEKPYFAGINSWGIKVGWSGHWRMSPEEMQRTFQGGLVLNW